MDDDLDDLEERLIQQAKALTRIKELMAHMRDLLALWLVTAPNLQPNSGAQYPSCGCCHGREGKDSQD